MCWIVVSFAWLGRLQNLRPLGSLFLVEVEFLWWVVVGGGCIVIIMLNPTRLRLGWGFDKTIHPTQDDMDVLDDKDVKDVQDVLDNLDVVDVLDVVADLDLNPTAFLVYFIE